MKKRNLPQTIDELRTFVVEQEEKLIRTLYGSKKMMLTFYGMAEFGTVDGINKQYENNGCVTYYDFRGYPTLERLRLE